MGNYDQRKQEEERRLQEILERLNDLFLDLSPPGPSRQAGSAPKNIENDSSSVVETFKVSQNQLFVFVVF